MNCRDFIELFRLFKICSNFHRTKARCCYILYIHLHTSNIIHSSSKTKTHLHIHSRNQIPNDILARNTINKASLTKRFVVVNATFDSLKPYSAP